MAIISPRVGVTAFRGVFPLIHHWMRGVSRPWTWPTPVWSSIARPMVAEHWVHECCHRNIGSFTPPNSYCTKTSKKRDDFFPIGLYKLYKFSGVWKLLVSGRVFELANEQFCWKGHNETSTLRGDTKWWSMIIICFWTFEREPNSLWYSKTWW